MQKHERKEAAVVDEFELRRTCFRRFIAELGVSELVAISEDLKTMMEYKANKMEVEQLNRMWFDGGHAA